MEYNALALKRRGPGRAAPLLGSDIDISAWLTPHFRVDRHLSACAFEPLLLAFDTKRDRDA
jgi:hypothetical protein